MQKAFAFILLLIYTCVSSGFAVSTHYCMDEKTSVDFGTVKKDVCQKCGMPKKEANGCCRDEVKVVKLQQDTQVSKLLLPSFEFTLPVVVPALHLNSPFYNFTRITIPLTFQPPPLQQGLYIENCVFRI